MGVWFSKSHRPTTAAAGILNHLLEFSIPLGVFLNRCVNPTYKPPRVLVLSIGFEGLGVYFWLFPPSCGALHEDLTVVVLFRVPSI